MTTRDPSPAPRPPTPPLPEAGEEGPSCPPPPTPTPASGPRPGRAPRGPERTCRGWVQEAALRMLMNNLDPEVAEDPDRLVVYGGSGPAGRGRADLGPILGTPPQ